MLPLHMNLYQWCFSIASLCVILVAISYAMRVGFPHLLFVMFPALWIGWIAVFIRKISGGLDVSWTVVITGIVAIAWPFLMYWQEGVLSTPFTPFEPKKVGDDGKLEGIPGRTFSPGQWVGIFIPTLIALVLGEWITLMTLA